MSATLQPIQDWFRSQGWTPMAFQEAVSYTHLRAHET